MNGGVILKEYHGCSMVVKYDLGMQLWRCNRGTWGYGRGGVSEADGGGG